MNSLFAHTVFLCCSFHFLHDQRHTTERNLKYILRESERKPCITDEEKKCRTEKEILRQKKKVKAHLSRPPTLLMWISE